MTISNEILVELLQGVERPKDLLGDAGLIKEPKINLMERVLGAERTAHLGYENGKDAPPGRSNRRNGQGAEGTGRGIAGCDRGAFRKSGKVRYCNKVAIQNE